MHQNDPNNAGGTDNDFMAGFNSEETLDGATAGTGTGQRVAEQGADGGAAGEGGGGAASASGDQFAAGMAGEQGTGDAGVAGGDAGAGGSAGEGVDTGENGEQGRAESDEIDLSGLPEAIRQRLEQGDQARRQAEELSGQLAAAQRDYHALHNRVAPLQQQLAAHQRAQQQPAAAADTGAGTSGAEGGGTVADSDKEIADAEAYFESDEFKRYADQWPEEAKIQRETQMRTLRAVRSLRMQMGQQVEALGRTVQQEVVPHLEQVRHTAAVQERTIELQQLSEKHPDWREINASDEFGIWYSEIRPLLNFQDAAHEARAVNNGEYVANLLTRFKRETGYGQQAQQQTAGQQGGGQQQSHQQGNAGGEGGTGGTTTSARLALAGSPGRIGGAPVQRQGASGITPGTDFMAGFNSTEP